MVVTAMPREVAEWIRRHALTARYLAGAGPIDVCPCQYGPCGYCRTKTHSKCSHRAWRPGPSCETYIVTRAGYALTPVYRSGRPCEWLCPCPCRRPGPKPPGIEREIDDDHARGRLVARMDAEAEATERATGARRSRYPDPAPRDVPRPATRAAEDLPTQLDLF